MPTLDEADIITYTESIGFDIPNWEQEMGMTMQEWLDNGHLVGDLCEFLPKDYSISMFNLGIDYRSGSPRFMKYFK